MPEPAPHSQPAPQPHPVPGPRPASAAGAPAVPGAPPAPAAVPGPAGASGPAPDAQDPQLVQWRAEQERIAGLEPAAAAAAARTLLDAMERGLEQR
ncbi:hypothetical protein BRM1_04695 [Brevibacterium sp. BRM-1]|uniref:hypothetical protein n=1 Tax=Brevibacterium sp. BRM-1 TaxID=2999062 RepID=UPI00227E1B4A|nr:hypothetical protein [Brevibacterium sp. BRM-1]WAL41161.1 hypothetical protein BRM1_04695 [Brevibacterium sp. BRM-1]